MRCVRAGLPQKRNPTFAHKITPLLQSTSLYGKTDQNQSLWTARGLKTPILLRGHTVLSAEAAGEIRQIIKTAPELRSPSPCLPWRLKIRLHGKDGKSLGSLTKGLSRILLKIFHKMRLDAENTSRRRLI